MASVLMCPPCAFGIKYSINPWMDVQKPSDWGKAMLQWTSLVDAYDQSGVNVQLVAPGSDVPDMVFTANGGIVQGGRAVPAKFLHKERTGEEPRFRQWFSQNMYLLKMLPVPFEGEGDCLRYNDTLLAGNGFRSSAEAYKQIAPWLKMKYVTLRLVDPRFYHLDLALAVVNDTIIWYPGAMDAESNEALRGLGPKTCELKEHEALSFCCNLFCHGEDIFLPASAIVPGAVEKMGRIKRIDVSEFMKSGGGVKCMTLCLD
jgi:N-dimethylarginine dimethylaminohydrolase